MKPSHRAVCLFLLGLTCIPLCGETWYVRPHGGTRHSGYDAKGQCDGKADADYPGKGVNQHCAFNDVRYFWTDTSYCTDNSHASACWKWVGKGGDTYLIRGSIASGATYRIGQNGPEARDYFGLPGNPYGAGAPPPPSGTPEQHTKILGENFASCKDQKARTQLHGGYGVGAVLNMDGASYVDVACLDITDFSSCGRSAQKNGCNTSFPLDDYAGSGILWTNTSTHDTVTDVRIHGLASLGMLGPTGDGVVMTNIDILGNAGAGWNADLGNGTTGVGSLLVQNFNISWNGCAEEYPIVHPLPYQDCSDDNIGGYGDGFGTATVESPAPGWQAHFDQGVSSYNTQDGLDAVHLIGAGSSMTVTNTLAYGNMGQQIKVGGAAGTATNNVIFTNCNALREAIPGTPPGYNSRLSDFCRAADTGVVMTVGDGSTTVFSDNIIYSAGATGLQINASHSCTTATCLIRQERNIFIGFRNNAANGYPTNGTGEFSNPLYVDDAAIKAYKNPGSSFAHNITFHGSGNSRCPNTQMRETHAYCGDPHLVDESWHRYGYGDTKTTPASPSPNAASPEATQPEKSETKSHGPVLTSLGVVAVATVGVSVWRWAKSRPSA